MRRSLIMRIAGVIILTGFVIVTVGNGCSNKAPESSSASTDVIPIPGGTGGGNGGITVIPGAKTVSVVNTTQVLGHLTSCAGVAQASDATIAMYEQKKGAISVYGTADTITAPMMMAITSIAGEVCNDLINQEIASGARIFTGFNMAANALPSQASINDAVTRMALSCWQRQETLAERSDIPNMVASTVGATEASASRKAALMVCTSVLSSLDALLN